MPLLASGDGSTFLRRRRQSGLFLPRVVFTRIFLCEILDASLDGIWLRHGSLQAFVDRGLRVEGPDGLTSTLSVSGITETRQTQDVKLMLV